MGFGHPVFKIAVLAFGVVGFGYSAHSAGCDSGVVELRGEWGWAKFSIEIANTAVTRSSGLMHRDHLPRLAGMLFVYDRPQNVHFWMENTLIPLDMIFADKTGLVTRVHANALPLDPTPIPGGEEIMFVLEINGGVAESIGINAGSTLRHPTIEQSNAVWPCSRD